MHQGEWVDTTYTLEPLANASAQDWLGSNQDPDVLVSVPNLGIDHIGLSIEGLRAHVEVHAKVLDLIELHVGADVSIDNIELDINNVRVQAMAKVKLEEVTKILTPLTTGLGNGLEKALERGGGSIGDITSGLKSKGIEGA